MEVRMQTRIGRSWTALRYDLSSQRALDNAAKMIAEHDRLLAEIDALARRLDEAVPRLEHTVEQNVEPPAPARSRDVA
jgi:hypothetical protein